MRRMNAREEREYDFLRVGEIHSLPNPMKEDKDIKRKEEENK